MFSKMVDMALGPEEKGKDYPMAMPMDSGQPKYPYGLSISLTDEELEKLDLEPDCEVGELIHLTAMAKVTSVSQNETTDGKRCRIELQIIALGAEDEDEEGEEEEEAPKFKRGIARLYK